MFPRLPARATFVADTNFVSATHAQETSWGTMYPQQCVLVYQGHKAMLHEAIFLATCNAKNVALQVGRKNSLVTPHFATAIVALRVARKVE